MGSLSLSYAERNALLAFLNALTSLDIETVIQRARE